MLALLAKLEPAQLTIAAEPLGGAHNSGGQIELVVADGVEVLLPMAGESDKQWSLARLCPGMLTTVRSGSYADMTAALYVRTLQPSEPSP